MFWEHPRPVANRTTRPSCILATFVHHAGPAMVENIALSHNTSEARPLSRRVVIVSTAIGVCGDRRKMHRRHEGVGTPGMCATLAVTFF